MVNKTGKFVIRAHVSMERAVRADKPPESPAGPRTGVTIASVHFTDLIFALSKGGFCVVKKS